MLNKIAEVEICSTEMEENKWNKRLTQLFSEGGYTVIQENDYSNPHFIIAVEDEK